MLINGVSITMDVAPEIKDGRTILPFRFKKGSCFEKNLFVVK